MNHEDYDEPVRDREISLGATTIFGIFLALTLVCALFFGLGFSMGRRSSQPAAVVTTPPEPTLNTTPKPTPETATTSPTTTSPAPASSAPPSTTATVPLTPATPSEAPEKPAKPAATAIFIVQIAAVSHREDADSLLAALEQRGYVVYIRQEPQDKLLHVQIGPFTTRRDADAMRQHLLADGYNAIVK
jgi:cell division septation protein DedD